MDHQTLVKFILETAGRTKWKIGLLVFVQAAISAITIAMALILRNVINTAAAGKASLFSYAMLSLVVFILIRLVLRAFLRFFQEDISSELENKWKSRLFATLMKKEFGCVSAVHSGEWMTKLTNDTVIVAGSMTNLLPDFCGMLVRLLGAIAAIVLLEPRFLYLILPGGILFIAVSYLSRRKMKGFHKRIQEQNGRLCSYLQECLSGMLVIRSYGTEQSVVDRAAEEMNLHKKARMRRNHFSNLCSTGFSVLMYGVYIAGAWFCGYGILTKTMSYGTFTAVLQLMGQLQAPFANISGFVPRFYAMLSSAERLMEAENLANAGTDNRKTLNEIQNIYEKGLEKIVLEDISFTYLSPSGNPESLQQPPTLSGWNFEIKKGSYTALTGPSGCGKSTLLKLLMCLYEPDRGQRYLQIQGRKVPLDGSWQKLFAYVPQGNYLMSGTIREMIAFSDTSRMGDDGAIQEALFIACADEFVNKLEDGVDTVLGERGAGLSEGQMQRLAIARAIFSGHPVLILDECSSALDEATEQQLLSNLRAMTSRTVILITHRPAALKICDHIWKIGQQPFLIRGAL